MRYSRAPAIHFSQVHAAEAQHGTFISYMFRTQPPSGPEGYNYSDWNCFTQSGDEYEHPSYVSPCGEPEGVAYADGLISLGSLSNPLNAVRTQ